MKKILIRSSLILALLLVVGSSAYAAVKVLGAANRGLVLDWKLDEGNAGMIADSSGNGNDGELYGSFNPSWVDPGRFGKALSFDGIDQYAESNDPIVSLGVIDQAYTISTWVKIDPSETEGNIVHLSTIGNGLGWCIPFLVYSNQKFSAISYNSGAQYATQPDTTSLDIWHHVVTTWSASNGLRLYVDGVLKETTPQANFTAANAPIYVHLARGNNGCTADTGMFEGSIDDTRVYSKELSQSQISALHSSNADSVATIISSTTIHGLTGDFYTGSEFETYVSSAVDSVINFDPADDSIGAAHVGQSDGFSARWTGYVTPAYSEEYTFTTNSDDGVRLYVNNELIIDNWTPHGPTADNGTIVLTAGRHYSIKLEFQEIGGGATIQLLWSSLSVPQEIIPESALSHGSNAVTTVNDSRNGRITGGLAGHWSFDGPDIDWFDATTAILYDTSGNSYHASVSGMQQATSPVPGKMGQALNFNGSSSCVTTDAFIFNNPNAFTLAGWVYLRSYGDTSFFGQNNSIEFGINSGDIKAWTPVASVQVSSSVASLNKWHHVALVAGSTGESIYVDGVDVADNPSPTGNYGTDTADTFSIGCNVWNGAGDYFDGKIDDVRAYTRALSANEIKQLYLIGK